MPDIHLSTFDPDGHLRIVTAWLHEPHVSRWWGQPERALDAIRWNSADSAMICVENRAIGFLQWQIPSREELAVAGLDDSPNDLIDIDMFIGELNCLGQGFGPIALCQLLTRLQNEGAICFGLATHRANLGALKAYHKAGFHPFRDFEEDGRRMQYMIQTMAAVSERSRFAV